MRLAYGVVIAIGCVHNGMTPQIDACTRSDHADPEACLAVARERFGAHDEDGARDYVEKLIAAFQAEPACLANHSADACFHGVVALLREPAVGLLAEYSIEPALLATLPPWTGSDSTGPYAQARAALEPMCKSTGDSIAQQRACLVLGDLVLLEQTKQIAGWDTAIDGYALACHASKVAGPFTQLVATTYEVSGADPVCAVATSPARGASISEARATIARIKQDAAQREASATSAATREAKRVAEMHVHEAEAAAAKAQQAVVTSNKQIVSASAAEDWELVLDTLHARSGLGPLDEPAASALARAWDSFVAWLVGQSSLIGADLELARDLHDIAPAGHSLVQALAALRDRAIVDARKQLKSAGGPGGRFLKTALLAQLYGADTGADAKAAIAAAHTSYVELAKVVRLTLVLDNLAPGCASLARIVDGKPVHATAALACTIEPEHVWNVAESYMVNGAQTPVDVEHRGFKLVIHGTITMAGQQFPVELDDIVDDIADKLDRSFDHTLAALVDSIWNQTVAPIENTTATDALAAGQKALAQNNLRRAENELVIHALIAGPSEELDKLLTPYRVTFAQLVP